MGVYAKKEEWQMVLLMKAFEDDPNWNKSKINSLSRQTGLSFFNIYKWCWDQRKLLKNSSFSQKFNSGILVRKNDKKSIA